VEDLHLLSFASFAWRTRRWVIRVGSGLSVFGGIADMNSLRRGRDGPGDDSMPLPPNWEVSVAIEQIGALKYSFSDAQNLACVSQSERGSVHVRSL